jgi:hypothetical protein
VRAACEGRPLYRDRCLRRALLILAVRFGAVRVLRRGSGSALRTGSGCVLRTGWGLCIADRLG